MNLKLKRMIYIVSWGIKLFLYCVIRGWKNIRFLGGTFVFKGLRGRSRPFSSIKPSITNHVNSRIVDDKNMFHVCMLTFLTFTWEFSACSSFHWNSQKSVYYCWVITLKVWILFDMSSESPYGFVVARWKG